MIINELKLISFGKFKGKTLNLKEGFNMIYGENEAGKTTIHKFIEGMFYGFFKPYSKRKVYSDDYDRYFPWKAADYRGVLKYSYNGQIYRVERNYAKGLDDVKIYDDRTGEDVTHLFEYDPVLRIHSPSSVLGLNSVVYSNTISIKQLGSKTENSLGKEVKDSLINIGGSLDEDISVKNAVEKLNKEIDSIGTKDRKKTSPYGKISEEIQVLQEEKEKVLKSLAIINEYEEKLKLIREENQKLDKERIDLKQKLAIIEKYEIKKKYEEASKLSLDIDRLTEELDEVKDSSNLNSDEFKEVLSLSNEKLSLEENIKEWNKELKKISKELDELLKELSAVHDFSGINEEKMNDILDILKDLFHKKERIKEIERDLKEYVNTNCYSEDNHLKDLSEDIYLYEDKEEQKNKVFYNNEYSNLLFLRTRLDEKSKDLKKLNVLATISTILVAVSIALGIKNNMFFLVALPFLGALIYTFHSKKEIKQYTEKLDSQIKQAEKEEIDKNDNIKKIEEELSNILKKYNCSSKIELKKMLDSNYEKSVVLKNKFETINSLEREKAELSLDINEKEKEMQKYLMLFNIDNDFDLMQLKSIEKSFGDFTKLKEKEKYLQSEKNRYEEKIKELSACRDKNISKMSDLLKRNDVDSVEQFELGLKNKDKYESLQKDIQNKKILLNKILDKSNIEYLKNESLKYDESINVSDSALDKEEIQEKLLNIENKISQDKLEQTRIEERINSTLSGFRPLVEVEEEIIRKEKVKKQYENRLRALTLAKNTIEGISKNIQRDFAPTLNKKVSEIVSCITDKKYKDVKITENINISIVDPESGMLIDIDKLSAGTIDQLYFATRFGIIDTIKEDKAPLILDDCFVQYDNTRLVNILKFLSRESENRQIILFTCQTREKEILQNICTDFNYIEL